MKLVTWAAAAALTLLAMIAGVPAAAEEAAPAPAFSVEQDTIDLGDVIAGSEAVAVFHFHNAGNAEVHIIRAKPS